MIYLGPSGLQVGFDLPGVVILIVAVAVFAAATRKAVPFTARLALGATTAALVVIQLSRGVMAPDESWIVMLAAIEESSGDERVARIRTLQTHWRHREMRALTWYQVSGKWGVCHAIWHQSDCHMPSVREDAAGIAREVLDEYAGNLPYQAPLRK